MTSIFMRQARFALSAGLVALVSAETSAFAFATAKNPTFEGSWLWAIGTVLVAVAALWLTCLGALRSDRGDRIRPTARTADRGGPVYTDIDGYMQVH